MKLDEDLTRRVNRGNPGLVFLLGGAGLLLLVWVVVELGSQFHTGQWAPGGANPVGVLMRFIRDGAPWSTGHTIAAALVVVAAFAALVGVARLLRWKNRSKVRGDRQARYLGKAEAFTEAAVKAHSDAANLTEGDVVGLAIAHVVRTNQKFWVGFRDGIIAEMGPGSGKTSSLVIPGAVEAPGPCWVTSNKPTEVAALYSARPFGRTLVFDPQQIADMDPEFYYDPLSDIRAGLRTRTTRDGRTLELDQRQVRAVELTQQLVTASRPADAKVDAFFDPAGQDLLTNMLLAAAVEHLPITKALEWLYRPESPVAADILTKHGLRLAAKAITATQQLAAETRDSVFRTAIGFLGFLQDSSALPWIQRTGPDDTRPAFDPDEYVRSKDLMICLSREGVGSFGPVVAAMTMATIRAAENYAMQCGGRLPLPLVMQLDEVANVCRIQSLPDLVSHLGSKGIFLAPYVQSAAQGRSAWGNDGWDKLFGATVVRLIGRGLIDMKHLGEMSEAIGDQPVVRSTTSRSSGHGSSTSRSENWTTERIMTPAQLAQLPQWRAVAIPAGERATLLRLTPWFKRPEMAKRIYASKAAFLAGRPDLAARVAAAEAEDIGDPTQVAVDAADS